MNYESSQRWLVMIPLVVLAAVVGLLVLVELQVLGLQRTVDTLVTEQTDEDTIAPVAARESETLVAIDMDENNGTVTQGVGTQIYTNTAYGYEVAIPQDSVIRTSQDDVFFAGETDFEIRRREWTDTDINKAFYLDAVPDSIVTINGEQAAMSISTTGYCDGPGCGAPYLAYSFLKDGFMTTLVFPGDVKLSNVESNVLQSFMFIE